MRNLLLAAVAAVILSSGTAFAQSQQGGYLGQNPGSHQTARLPAPSANANEALMSSPTAWCKNSPEPSRCTARSAAEHQICLQNPDNYASCRFAMDQMHPY
jgi:hypothetical protein